MVGFVRLVEEGRVTLGWQSSLYKGNEFQMEVATVENVWLCMGEIFTREN